MSRAVDRSNGKTRKVLQIDVKKAHLNSDWKDDLFIELLVEVGAAQDNVVKARVIFWTVEFHRPAMAMFLGHLRM